jgi:hypothetical protein
MRVETLRFQQAATKRGSLVVNWARRIDVESVSVQLPPGGWQMTIADLEAAVRRELYRRCEADDQPTCSTGVGPVEAPRDIVTEVCWDVVLRLSSTELLGLALQDETLVATRVRSPLPDVDPSAGQVLRWKLFEHLDQLFALRLAGAGVAGVPGEEWTWCRRTLRSISR